MKGFNDMKRIVLSILLTVIVLCGLSGVKVFAEYYNYSEDTRTYTWDFTASDATLTGGNGLIVSRAGKIGEGIGIQWSSTNSDRHIKYTPEYDGTLTYTMYYSNGPVNVLPDDPYNSAESVAKNNISKGIGEPDAKGGYMAYTAELKAGETYYIVASYENKPAYTCISTVTYKITDENAFSKINMENIMLVDGEVNADVFLDEEIDGTLWCCLYDNQGTLLSIKEATGRHITLNALNCKTGYIKGYLWGGKTKMEPLSEPFKKEFNELADKTELNRLIALYDSIDISAYEKGVSEFSEAMAAAKIISSDETAIQKQANQAVSDLISAKGKMSLKETIVGERTVINQNADWLFVKEKNAKDSAEEIITDDDSKLKTEKWEQLSLPHTWNAQDGTDGGKNYDRCKSWYRKTMLVDKNLQGKKIYLEFGAAGTVCDLYINGIHIPYAHYDIYSNGNSTEYSHKGGFSAFRYDVTDYVNYGEGNLVSVCVDNSWVKEVAPCEGDFNMQGGLYRDVNLVAVNPIHVDMNDYGSSGVYFTPKKATDVTDNDNKDFNCSVESKIINDSTEDKIITINASLRHPDHYDVVDNDYIREHLRFNPADMYIEGGAVAAVFPAETVTISAGESYDYSKQILVQSPRLWDGLKDPYRYEAVLTITDESGIKMEEITVNIGFKYTYMPTPEYKDGNYNGGKFYLNGREYILRGAGKHQDWGRGETSVGAAVTDKERINDCALMYEVGMNSVRLVHYQHSLEEIELYDRLGILVWSELGFVDYCPSENTTWYNNFLNVTKAQFTELIKQQYNSPSIYIWSMSNEVSQEYSENAYLDKNTKMNASTAVKIHSELYNTAKALDKVRPVTYANFSLFGRTKDWDSDAAAINYYPYWYSYGEEYYGGNSSTKDMFEYHFNKLIEKKPMGISEYGGSAVVGYTMKYDDDGTLESLVNTEGGKDNQYTTTYQSYLHEKVYSEICNNLPYLYGSYIWQFIDSQSDKKGSLLKGMNDKGLVSYDHKTKKDSFYFYKANWNDIEPFVHIVNKDCKEVSGIVRVYSNCEKVQLYVNGEKYGEPIDDINNSDGVVDGFGVFMWYDVSFLNAENNIEVRGIDGSGAEITGVSDVRDNIPQTEQK